MATYLYTDVKANVDGMVHKKVDDLKDARVVINRAARTVIGDVDLRSTKKKSAAVPNLFSDVYQYAWPTDGKAKAIIDVSPQVNRGSDSELTLKSQEEFDRLKSGESNIVAFQDDAMVKKILINMIVDDDETVISELDSLTSGGGTWALFGDGTNLTADADNFVNGNGSINWDISAAGGTTAGIQNDGLDSFDLTDYLPQGAIFVWVYITSTTNLTNFILRVGSGSSAYYYKTITTTHEGTAFVNGWNLLRFDLQSLSSSGSPDITDCTYVAIYMTKAGAKISETDYRFDWIVSKRGVIHNLWYYSKYPWQTTAAVWIENSVADTDYINADTDELELISIKAAEYASQELKEYKDVQYFQAEYVKKRADYVLKNPSEAKMMITEY